MQIKTDDIKRPQLITPFFTFDLTLDNEFFTYIETTNQNSVTHKHNITISSA